jgi:hypothetical protein
MSVEGERPLRTPITDIPRLLRVRRERPRRALPRSVMNSRRLIRVRPVLLVYSSKLPGSRVLEDHYGANLVGMVVPKGQTERLAYISEFIEQARASGLVQQAIERAALPGHRAAPTKTN